MRKNKSNKNPISTSNTKVKKEKKNIFLMLIDMIKYFSLGVFTVFDYFFTFIISLITYIYWGFKIIFTFIWKFGIGFVILELYRLIIAIITGITYILSLIFYELPTYIINKISNFFTKINLFIKKIKNEYKTKSTSGKSFTQRIKEYVSGKYNNISFVRDARERKEAALTILVVNQTGEDAQKSESKRTYKYIARNKEGKIITGYFAALSRLDVYSYLIDEGLVVYDIKTSWAINFFHAEAAILKKKMKNKYLIFWLAQLSTYIKSGIPLTEAVKILAKQDKKKKYKPVFDSVIYELTMGASFSESLEKQGTVFPALLINMIKSAELIGSIESTLDEMSSYYQEIEETKKAVVSALTYPAIVLIFSIGVIVFLLIFIIPEFVNVYDSMNAEISPITQATLNISNYLISNWKIILLYILLIFTVFLWLYKKVRLFKMFIQTIIMKIPVIGKIVISKEITLFAKTFANLNKNNVLLTDSIDILRKITNNEIYKGIMFRTINNLVKGEKMSASFKDNWAIPEVAYYMIVTGESTGELSSMLDKVGEFYQEQQRNTISQLKTFIEPILISFLAIGVGFIIISVLIPMYGAYETIL